MLSIDLLDDFADRVRFEFESTWVAEEDRLDLNLDAQILHLRSLGSARQAA